MASEKLTSKVHAWFCSTNLPSDIVIQVDDMSFHLHKLPLILKSKKLYNLITEVEKISNAKVTGKEGEERDEETYHDEEDQHITLQGVPGGSETFEIAAKFCYGVKIDMSPSNIAALCCAGEFLQMTEEHFEQNLISMTEIYFSQNVLTNIKYSIQTLYSCQSLLPFAENLGIVQRCIDSIADNASYIDPSLFGWPINGGATPRRRLNITAITAPNYWYKELGVLNVNIFERLILAMKSQNTKPEIIESCLISYAWKHKLLNSRANRKSSSSSSSSNLSEIEQRELLETIIAYLPMQRSSSSPTSTRSICGLLRTANILHASESCLLILEKKIGSKMEQATLDDLLIPSYSYLTETLYDVDYVERILDYFLEGLEGRSPASGDYDGGGEEDYSGRLPALMTVGKLIDDYLSEVASDANLKPDRFYQLAVSLPEHARLFEDGLYRAIDIFLKVHPWISDGEKEKICGIIDCQKLTPEACTHAAQNERLPLRTVVQVLFFEQLQLRHVISETALSATVSPVKTPRRRMNELVLWDGGQAAACDIDTFNESPNAWKENQVLRRSMHGMKTRMHELEHECSTMKKVIEKIDKVNSQDKAKCWSSKIGCKFNTQVCDSRQPMAVVEYRKGRSHHNHNRHRLTQ